MHNTEKISIKTVHVDKKIKNLVLWLNGFTSVRTLWSCQGFNEKEKKGMYDKVQEYFTEPIVPYPEDSYAYVVFTCNNLDHLYLIIDCIQEFKCYKKDIGLIKTEVSSDREDKRLKYELVIANQECPDMIVKYWNNVYKPRIINKTKLIP